MRKRNFLSLDYAKIEQEFPMAVEKLVDWFSKREDVIAGAKASGIRMEEITDLSKKTTAMIVQYDPRKLYEFFDDQKIFIYIGSHPDSDELYVYHNSKINHSKPADTRIQAEAAAFTDAFKVLEEQLTTY